MDPERSLLHIHALHVPSLSHNQNWNPRMSYWKSNHQTMSTEKERQTADRQIIRWRLVYKCFMRLLYKAYNVVHEIQNEIIYLTFVPGCSSCEIQPQSHLKNL